METPSSDSIQLTPEQVALLAGWSRSTGKSPAELLQVALHAFDPESCRDDLSRVETDRTFFDRLNEAGMVGCLKGMPADLSTNPAYMEGFGK